jgi:glutathione S-transferase
MAQYKLNYFNGRGRAELSRLVFAAAGQKYEDHRFEREQWPELKAKTPFGQAPWLEIHDNGHVTVLAQSVTIGNNFFLDFRLI